MVNRKLAGILGMAVALSAFAACTSSTTATPSAGTTSAASSEAPKVEYKLGWYAPAPHPYFDQVKKGVEQFVSETGINVDMQIGPDFNQASENQRVEAMAAQGTKGISIYPSDASGANGLYDELDQAGVAVVNFGADTKRPNKSKFAIATDVSRAAYDACTNLVKIMGGKGNIINVLEVLEDPNTALRKAAIDKCVGENAGVKVIQEVAGIKNQEEAVSKIESALAANAGKIDGIIATGFTPSVGLAQLLPDYYSKNKDSKHIVTITIDTDPTVVKAIKDGVLDGTIAQNPVGHGYISMMVLKLLQDGYMPATEAPLIEAGHLLVTKDNADTFETDLTAVTKSILAELPTKYLKK